MADITVYTLEVVKPGSPQGGPYETLHWGDFETQDYGEARRLASNLGLLVIGNTYTWSDSEPLDDYTPRCEVCGIGLARNDRKTSEDSREGLCGRHSGE